MCNLGSLFHPQWHHQASGTNEIVTDTVISTRTECCLNYVAATPVVAPREEVALEEGRIRGALEACRRTLVFAPSAHFKGTEGDERLVNHRHFR